MSSAKLLVSCRMEPAAATSADWRGWHGAWQEVLGRGRGPPPLACVFGTAKHFGCCDTARFGSGRRAICILVAIELGKSCSCSNDLPSCNNSAMFAKPCGLLRHFAISLSPCLNHSGKHALHTNGTLFRTAMAIALPPACALEER